MSIDTTIRHGDTRVLIAVSIANNQFLSSGVYIGGMRVIGIEMPATWNAANLSFQASEDNVTYQELFDDAGAAIAVTTGQAKNTALGAANRNALLAFPWLKVRSGTSGGPVTQSGDRVINLICDPNL